MPVGQHPVATRIADYKSAFVGQLRGVHEPAQLILVHGTGDGEMRDGAQCSHVEGAVVRGTVFAHQSGPIKAEHHGQTQQRQVVDDVVVGALSKGAVDVAEGLQPVFGHAARESDGVPFGNAHIENALWHFLLHDGH